ncbi:uncharacterized protein LOC110905606 [Helianthus annuus]|uniref:uncharacterized protein LOC110905606 n=1 Tax=Helianthus annuus TaxID=4232 RepID=UPI000B8F1900|nr:uncharacterized protein LOC110905606 [Helianthus annuus]
MNQLNSNEVIAAFPPSNLAEQPVPFDLPPHGLDNGGSLGLQHSYDYQFNTMLAQNQSMIEYSTINNESSDMGNSASSSNMDSNLHQLQRTFTDDLSMYLAPHPDNALFDSNGIMVQNQGVPNMSSNLNFQNSGFAEMSQRSNFFS